MCLTIKVKPANILLLLKNISFEFQGKSLTRVNLSGLTQRFLETCANKSALSLCYSGQMTSKVQIQVPKYLSCDDPLSPGRPIYHTNVFMSIMTSLAVICMEAIQGDEARADLEVIKTHL